MPCIRRLVKDSLDKFNLLKNGESFKFHVQRCKSLCTYILDKVPPYIRNDEQYLGGDVWSERVQKAWKEIYRVMKEAETYLNHCSTQVMKCLILDSTGEAFALHMHDFAWSLLCLDLAILCPIEEWNDKIGLTEFRKRISDSFAEMSDLHLNQIDFKFEDYCDLRMACNQAAANAWSAKRKYKIGVLQFMERKLLETIRNERKTRPAIDESATGIPAWLQIPAKDLTIKNIIGEGSFGKVYMGSWLGHKVAVKDIPVDARDLFEREIAVLSKLHSPFIVQLIGTSCIERRHCRIVMELVSSSLDKVLKNSGCRASLALPVAVDMMLQISRGMEYLHRQGIMHMDLKASNVLVEPSAIPEFREQGYGRVKLCDFGMASLGLSSFRCEDPKGTCYWRAPEAFRFPDQELLQEIDTLKEYTYKADVYSFAMTCYEILTGIQPFLGVHPKGLYRMIVQGKRPILLQPSCPAVLADYIGKCWETDPGRRPCFAQVSTFMRNMKLCLLRWNDPRDWPAKSDGYFYPHDADVPLELVTSKEEAFDEIPADEKLKSIARAHRFPPEIKRYELLLI
ncbi:serine/threonine-protein kinase STY13 [Cryptomeria japonica]|uniref:serine/threonine-protein kinase STY13 n=1 Tax=Cryptomeria japonica TaxID=3369 RepID=UPI0027DA3025|nr:serine/threonine-protein kinase STY13 [Cryptomeria japonica]